MTASTSHPDLLGGWEAWAEVPAPAPTAEGTSRVGPHSQRRSVGREGSAGGVKGVPESAPSCCPVSRGSFASWRPLGLTVLRSEIMT